VIKKAMIMAAGVGSRLDPLTQCTPKPLIPIANMPVMDLLLARLDEVGIKNVISNTHCLAEQIHDRYTNANPTSVNCNFVYEDQLSGTAGGVKKCEWFFEKGETFLVMSGDGLTSVDLKQLINSHKKSGAIATMGLTRVPQSEVCHFGVVVTDSNNKVIEFQEKPDPKEAKSNLVNTGIYIFETRIFDYIPANTFFDFAKNVFPALMKNNETINSFIINDYWSDIGTLNQYRISTADVLQGKVNINMPYPETDIGWCANTSSIKSSSVKNGKIIIGENSIVDENAELYGYNVIGNNCHIKSGAKLTNCIIWDNVIIEDNVEMNDCIIAHNSIIKEGIHLEDSTVISAGSVITSDSPMALKKSPVL